MDYLNVAIEASRKAGQIHKKYFGKDFRVKTKLRSFDLLSVADTEAESSAVGIIRKHFPDHNFLAEEHKYRKTRSPYTWIIDPLDGTNNFVSGLPIFCASVGLAYKNEVIAGAVYDVTRQELFSAAKYSGSFLNAKRIRVSSTEKLSESILITGFYYNRGREMIQTLEAIKRFFSKNIRGLRRLGAAALDLCYVASGRASGFWEFELSPWDFAAGKLILEEAGGRVTGRHGEEVPLRRRHYIIASNGKIHSQMLSVINKK